MWQKDRHSNPEHVDLTDDALALKSVTSADMTVASPTSPSSPQVLRGQRHLRWILALLVLSLVLAAWQMPVVAQGGDWHLALLIIGAPMLLTGFLILRQGQLQAADETALRQSEMLRRKACHMARLCHWRINLKLDPTGTLGVDDYSGEVSEIFGVGPEQLMLGGGDYYRNLVHPEDAARAQGAFATFLAQQAQRTYAIEYRIRHADGNYRVIRETAEKMLDQDGRPSEVIGTIQDISDLHQAVNKLMLAEGQLDIAHRLANLGYWYWQPPPPDLDHDRGYYYSPELLAILRRRVSTQSYSDTSYTQDFVHPDDRCRVLSILSDYRDGRIDTYVMEYRAIPEEGSILYLRSVAERRRDDMGRAIFAIGIVQDITPLRETALSLEVTLQQLNVAHRLANVGFWRWQPPLLSPTASADDPINWHGYQYSAAQLDLLGIDAQTMQNSNTENYCTRFVHPDDQAHMRALYGKWDRGDIDDYTTDYRFIRPDGRVVSLHAVAHRARDADDKPIFAIGLFQDVTASKEREALLIEALRRAEAANHAKTQFLAHMSHELRTPLNAAIGFADTMALGLLGQIPEAYSGYAEAIASSGRHLLTAIDEILMASQLELTGSKLEELAFRLDEVITSTAKTLAADAISAEVIIDLLQTNRPILVNGDVQAISLALRHVIAVAIKTVPAGGTLQLRLTKSSDAGEGDWLDVIIGTGDIGPQSDRVREVLERSYQPLLSLSSNAYLATSRGGLHFGLDIARRFLELHGGRLIIVSTNSNPADADDRVEELLMILRLPASRLRPIQ